MKQSKDLSTTTSRHISHKNIISGHAGLGHILSDMNMVENQSRVIVKFSQVIMDFL